MQMLYDQVWIKHKNGQIAQAMNDLPSVLNDEESAMRGAGMIGIEKFGPEDDEKAFIMNKDLRTKNVTSEDTKELRRALHSLLFNAPDKKHLGFFFFSCHGMIRNFHQHILLNEFDFEIDFYRLFNAEKLIRNQTENYRNCYIVCIFACCREIYKPS